MRSPGDNSDAPLARPTVPLFIRWPGAYSDAPGPVLVFEFCISWPGLYWDAPGEVVPPWFCATAKEAVPSRRAVATAIVLVILVSLGESTRGINRRHGRVFRFW